jgi:hypothetical protein
LICTLLTGDHTLSAAALVRKESEESEKKVERRMSFLLGGECQSLT